MSRRNYVLDAIDPEPELELSLGDMVRFGLSEGDIVRVTSARGALEIKVKATVNQPDGLGYMPWMFREAPGAALTSTVTDPRTGSPELKYTPVKLERLRASVRGIFQPGADLRTEVVEGSGSAAAAIG
jgi:formate dehydrogenase major subunit